MMKGSSRGKHYFQTAEDVISFMSNKRIETAYLFIGNGPKLQYKDMSQVEEKLQPIVDNLQCMYGQGNWLAVYGGDTFVKENPDLGAVMALLKNKYKVPILSVQGWPEVDDFVDYTLMYDGEKDLNGRIVYGGLDGEKLLGGTKIYLGHEFRQILGGVVNLDARGKVGKAEVAFAREINLNVIDVAPLTPKKDTLKIES